MRPWSLFIHRKEHHARPSLGNKTLLSWKQGFERPQAKITVTRSHQKWKIHYWLKMLPILILESKLNISFLNSPFTKRYLSVLQEKSISFCLDYTLSLKLPLTHVWLSWCWQNMVMCQGLRYITRTTHGWELHLCSFKPMVHFYFKVENHIYLLSKQEQCSDELAPMQDHYFMHVFTG